jgi:hypothetical protein
MGTGENLFDAKDLVTRWKSPGPKATAFVQSSADAAFICGPVGSGKSTAADVVKPLMKAQLQVPGANGVRHYRLVTFRDTQRNAWKSTIPTVRKWITTGKFVGSEDRPCRLEFDTYHIRDGGLIKCEFWWYGMPTDRDELEKSLKGLETTDINLAEADQLPRFAFEWAIGRIGRHPSGALGKVRLPQIFGTLNATDFDSWIYDTCVANPLDGMEFFHQAPALLTDRAPFVVNPAAENLKNIENGEEYYLRQARMSRPGHISRALMAKFGPVEGDGFLVYPEFVDTDHACEFEYQPGDVFLSIDAGSTPAATIKQWGPNGQLDTIDEVVIYDPNDPKRMTLRFGVGPTQFADAVKMTMQRYPDLRLKLGWIDPSAFYGGDGNNGDLCFADKLARELDIPILPAPTPGNARVMREEGTRLQMSKRGDGGRPMYRVHKRCRWLLMGLRGRYLYQTTIKDGVATPSNLRAVIKNFWSHVCEANEYGDAGMLGGSAVLRPVTAMHQYKIGQRPQVNKYQSGGVRW